MRPTKMNQSRRSSRSRPNIMGTPTITDKAKDNVVSIKNKTNKVVQKEKVTKEGRKKTSRSTTVVSQNDRSKKDTSKLKQMEKVNTPAKSNISSYNGRLKRTPKENDDENEDDNELTKLVSIEN